MAREPAALAGESLIVRGMTAARPFWLVALLKTPRYLSRVLGGP
jgi:hypothetical protein